MALRAIKLFLIKIVPVFVVSMVAWQKLGISKIYHAVLASVLNLFPVFDRSGLDARVMSEPGKFGMNFSYSGTITDIPLDAFALQITGNAPLLIALYLSSPIMPLRRTYVVYFVIAFLGLFLTHVCTTTLLIQLGVMTTPGWADIASFYDYGTGYMTFLKYYKSFYEIFGLYLFVLVLWLPYIGTYVVRTSRGQGYAKEGVKKFTRSTADVDTSA